ncbi:MAG: hypothetical protein DRH93_08395 [Deltaproteobacteria bacterium]|nr:MAG: hypothetical protein DRH93_08395 [Deltaproteobacteria bacterium]
MNDEKGIRISGKNLSSVLMPDFCPTCFWIKNNMKVPWQIFPGIFSSIDAYTKKMVHLIFDETGNPPTWMPEIADALTYGKTLHWSKFKRFDTKTWITVSGMEDDVFIYRDKSRTIVDYKTAKYTKNQDKLLPLYEGQLNMYSWIEEGLGNEVRDDLPLIYCEPITDPLSTNYNGSGFSMPFEPKTLIVKKDREIVRRALDIAGDIVFGKMPELNPNCKDCQQLSDIIAVSLAK